MITIEKLNHSHVDEVKTIQLADEQINFAGTAAEFLADVCETTHLHVIKHHKRVIGFFKIDIAYASKYNFCPEGGLGLRAFAIDKAQQGKGFGTKVVRALFAYLKVNYPRYTSIYLTVNCKNPGAVVCYLNGGFQDTAEKYLEGPAGPQHIMR